MDLRLSTADLDVQRRAREFTDEHLIPYEAEVEEAEEISEGSLRKITEACLDAGLYAMNHEKEDGGAGLSIFHQLIASEQMGRATNGLWWLAWRPAIPLRFGTPEQKRDYLLPACRGERRDAYGVTEAGAGSDPTGISASARREGGDYVINGEKWFLTAANLADFLMVHAHVDGDPSKPTVFLVEKDAPGVRFVRTPRYMHTYVVHHPIVAFEDVRVPAEKVLGEVGEGFELTKDWFVEARLLIGAYTIGASERALELALDWARERVTFGRPLIENQAISFALADMATELAVSRAYLYRVAWQASSGDVDRRQIHALAASLKLHSTESEGRIVDQAVQIMGGRGYMREHPVERLYREARVERIWEGSSEMLRLVIGRELAKRGTGVYAGWPQ